jgi:membrane peptidoglycan carboxypeptidase
LPAIRQFFTELLANRARRRTVLTAVAAVAAIALLLFTAAFAYAVATLPDPSRLDLTGGAIRIVDRHGTLIEERNAQGERTVPVDLKKKGISRAMVNATIAAEDRHFYAHHGVDWGRVVKAFFVDVVARRPEQGASTITQQLAKNAIIRSPSKTPLRKLRELILATQLESRYKKDEILNLYLNTIYYGHRATGIEVASEVYFGMHASELDLAEASLLAALPAAPSYFDPRLHPDRAKARQQYVLDGMVKQHMISQDEADRAAAEKLSFAYKEQRATLAPHFVDYVFEELERLYGPSAVARGGFKVTTSLDLTLQQAAQHSVELGIQQLGSKGADNGDLVALDPRTGEILAMVGSVDFYNDSIKGQYNVVTALRQPGSSFKPYVYEQAFRSRQLTMGSLLDDTSSHFAQGQFHDFDYRNMGLITAHQALVLSRNIPALETMQKAGYAEVIALAHAFGITSDLKPEVTTAIGSSEVRLLDHAVGYGTFATGGVKHAAVAVLEVSDRSGHVLDKANLDQSGQRVVSPAEAYLVTDILKDYSAAWHLGWNRPMAGKSGTTNDYHDAWMMAYAPNIVVGAWVGHTGPGDSNMNGVYGTMVGSSVLRDFINNGLTQAGIPVMNFQRPSGLVDGNPCQPAEGQASSVDPSEVELYLPGTETQCPKPTPTPSPSSSASPGLLPSLSPLPLLSPTPSLAPTPAASSTPTPTPR